MEELFTTNLAVDHQPVSYRVAFEEEQYNFISEANHSSFPAFSFKRENDAWHDQGLVPPEIKKQALDALEQYLLKQH